MIIDDYLMYLSIGWMLGTVSYIPGIVIDWTFEIIGRTLDRVFDE